MTPPTGIEYRERLSPPPESYRNVEVYGEDRERRLEMLPHEVEAFEKAVTTVSEHIVSGNFIRR